MTAMSAPGAPPSSAPRADASMSLLVDLMTRDALDQGYEEAAARRHVQGRTATPSPSRALRLGAIALVGMLLALAAVSLREGAPAAARAKARLRDQVEAR